MRLLACLAIASVPILADFEIYFWASSGIFLSKQKPNKSGKTCIVAQGD
jgi:hypothetical protein